MTGNPEWGSSWDPGSEPAEQEAGPPSRPSWGLRAAPAPMAPPKQTLPGTTFEAGQPLLRATLGKPLTAHCTLPTGQDNSECSVLACTSSPTSATPRTSCKGLSRSAGACGLGPSEHLKVWPQDPDFPKHMAQKIKEKIISGGFQK